MKLSIRPMILKDVASITGYDLSVISRATAAKYVATARGVYPLKMFFNERPKDDEDTSTHEILAALKAVDRQGGQASSAERRGYNIDAC